MRMKRWQQSTEQKNNNRGSSIVTVIVVMTIIAVIAALIMTLALVNFRMKNTNQGAWKNFYTAETALEEIRQGLCDELSAAMEMAYVDTVQKYSELTPADREKNFRNELQKNMLDRITGYNASSGTYAKDYLTLFLKETAYDDVAKTGAKLFDEMGAAELPHLNIEQEGADLLFKSMTFKNVSVRFYGEEGYVTDIETDIRLECPKIYFSQNSRMPDLTMYALVAQDHVEIENGRTCEISGNAYLGRNATEIEQATLTLKRGRDNKERAVAISGAMLKGMHGAQLQVSEAELWTKNLVVDSSKLTAQDTAVYLQNDLVLSNSEITSTSAVIGGEFYGYGNIRTAPLADSIRGNAAELDNISKNPADYSSSIIINGVHSSLDLSGLHAMKISGNSYVNGKAAITDKFAAPYPNMNQENVLIGSSLSIRADQVAYLVPPECIAPGTKNGGINPMPIDQYGKLLEELKKIYGNANADDKLVDLTVATKKYGKTLAEFGVDGWQLEAQQVNGVGSMIYVFLKFDKVEHANTFFRAYYDSTDKAKLGAILDLYDGTGIRLPDEVLNQTTDAAFYFNGNVLASDAASLYVPDKLSGVSTADADALAAEEMHCQDNYAALNTKLCKEYMELTDAEKSRTVYENLVKSMISPTDPKYTIAADSHKIFLRDTGEAAVVANGDYTVDASTISPQAGQTLAVVIAAGNITVKTDFNGILIAGGSVIVKNSAKLTADAKTAEKALMASNADGICTYDYLVDGECYAVAGGDVVVPGGYSGERIAIQDCVTYENWSRQ